MMRFSHTHIYIGRMLVMCTGKKHKSKKCSLFRSKKICSSQNIKSLVKVRNVFDLFFQLFSHEICIKKRSNRWRIAVQVNGLICWSRETTPERRILHMYVLITPMTERRDEEEKLHGKIVAISTLSYRFRPNENVQENRKLNEVETTARQVNKNVLFSVVAIMMIIIASFASPHFNQIEFKR